VGYGFVILKRGAEGLCSPYPLLRTVLKREFQRRQVLTVSSFPNYHAKKCFDTSFVDD
jgi:hypothetical protein